MTPAVLQRLRSETKAAHESLEAAVQIEQRVREPAAYRELLEHFLGFYQPLEEALAALPRMAEYGFELAERRKTPWLESDLAALAAPHEKASPVPRCAALPRVDSLARGFGVAYVLEGATLGGRHISQMLRDSAIPESARRFFSSYGPAVGERWQEFVQSLGSFAEQSGGEDDLVAAARETFSTLQGWICRKQ